MAEPMQPGRRTTRGNRTKVQVAADRERVCELYLKGRTMAQIGDELNISTPTVCRDLKAIQEQWLKSSLVAFDAIKARELARIDELETEAWDAWKDSRGVHQRTQTKRIVEAQLPVDGRPKPKENPVRTEANVTNVPKRDGNAQFLMTIQWCVEQRCKIFGLYAPVKFKVEELDGLIEREFLRLNAGGEAAEETDPDKVLALMPATNQ